MSSSFYDFRARAAELGKALRRQGWTLSGWKDDKSDSMTDYYDPESWNGTAKRGRFTVVAKQSWDAGSTFVVPKGRGWALYDGFTRVKTGQLPKREFNDSVLGEYRASVVAAQIGEAAGFEAPKWFADAERVERLAKAKSRLMTIRWLAQSPNDACPTDDLEAAAAAKWVARFGPLTYGGRTDFADAVEGVNRVMRRAMQYEAAEVNA